jgi:tRNA pseudouridine38-40 synthase
VNIKLTIEYDGSHYHGWQVQARGATVQGVLERAVSVFTGRETRIIGSGRTDAGVHALGQVANFFCDPHTPVHKMERALNALTPPDVSVRDIEIVADSFNARRDARSRTYEYRILNRRSPSPFKAKYAWHVHDRLDVSGMQAAVTCLQGEHDFSSFRAAGCDAVRPSRIVYHTAFSSKGDLLIFSIEATAFLRHMVRNIVGTVIEVGRKQRSPQSIADLLRARDRTKAGPKAPPQGLFLTKVNY